MAKILNWSLKVRTFEPLLSYYFPFPNNTLKKKVWTPYPSSYGLNKMFEFFLLG